MPGEVPLYDLDPFTEEQTTRRKTVIPLAVKVKTKSTKPITASTTPPITTTSSITTEPTSTPQEVYELSTAVATVNAVGSNHLAGNAMHRKPSKVDFTNLIATTAEVITTPWPQAAETREATVTSWVTVVPTEAPREPEEEVPPDAAVEKQPATETEAAEDPVETATVPATTETVVKDGTEENDVREGYLKPEEEPDQDPEEAPRQENPHNTSRESHEGDGNEAEPENGAAVASQPVPEAPLIRIERESQKLRIEWDPPDAALCDTYVVNYTILTLSRPKSFVIASSSAVAYIKFYTGHKIRVC